MATAQTSSPLTRRVYDAERDRRRGRLVNPFYLFACLCEDALQVYRFRMALANMVGTRLKVRYQRSFLGFLWTLLNPLLMLAVLSIVRSVWRGRSISEVIMYLFAGLLPWQFFSATISHNATAMVSNQQLIRKIYVPKLVFPTAGALVNAVNMVFAMAALFVLLQLVGAPVATQFVLLPIAIGLLLVFSLGLGLVLMVLTTFYRDMEHMISVVLRAGFFLSPILWEVGGRHGMRGRSEWFDWIIRLNPMTYMLELFHTIFYYHTTPHYPDWPSMEHWLILICLTVGAALLGYAVYKKYEPKLIFRL
ncbi:MAG: ABC transporter permease [Phycisphaerae bacterium]|nr:ABC transporter permease [Phycisphaerae bacterium]